jgi:hypothetical protein
MPHIISEEKHVKIQNADLILLFPAAAEGFLLEETVTRTA